MVYKKKIEKEWTSDTCLSDIVILLLTRPLFPPYALTRTSSQIFIWINPARHGRCYPIRGVCSGIGGGQHFCIYTQKRFTSATINQKFQKNVFPLLARNFFCFSQAQLVRVDWWRRCTREWNESTRKSVHPFPDRLTEKTNSRWEDVDVSTLVSGCCRLSVGSNLTTSNKKTACVWGMRKHSGAVRVELYTQQRKSLRTKKYITLVGPKRCERCHSSPVDLLLYGPKALFRCAPIGENTITHSDPRYLSVSVHKYMDEAMCVVPTTSVVHIFVQGKKKKRREKKRER